MQNVIDRASRLDSNRLPRPQLNRKELDLFGPRAYTFTESEADSIIFGLAERGYECDAFAQGCFTGSCAYSGEGKFPYYVFVEKNSSGWSSEIVALNFTEDEADEYERWIERINNMGS